MSDDPEIPTSWTLAAIKERRMALEGDCEAPGCNHFFSFDLEKLIELFGADYHVPEYLPMECLECGGRLKFKLAMIPPEA